MPDHYYNHSRRNQRSLSDSYNASAYPGLSSYAPSALPGETGILPALGAEAATETALALPAAEAATKASGGLAGLLSGLGGGGGIGGNMEQIKGIIDRMGGIDGIVNSMGKVQKVMSGFQQMAPMVKLFMGSFGKNKGAAGALAAEEDAALYSPNRRKKAFHLTPSQIYYNYSPALYFFHRKTSPQIAVTFSSYVSEKQQFSRERDLLLALLLYFHLNQPLRRNHRNIPKPTTSINSSTPK